MESGDAADGKSNRSRLEAPGEQSERSIPDPMWHSMSAPRGGS